MADTFSKNKRRKIMQSVRRVNTRPEELLAQHFDEAGLKYEQNTDVLPGKPDFFFPEFKLVVFVHGCFWHGHPYCRKGQSRPKSNRAYWRQKVERNQRRDHRTARALRRAGFSVFTVWECQITQNQAPKRLLNILRQRCKVDKGIRENG